MIPRRKVHRLCEVSYKMLLIRANIINKEGMNS